MDLVDFNALDPTDATDLLLECCHSRAWAQRMVAERPYRDSTSLFIAAAEVWWDLDLDDWREAFAAHPPGPAEYRDRFGHPYVVYPNGRDEAALKASYRTRLLGDPLTEIQAAAVEQARITNRALRDLLDLV